MELWEALELTRYDVLACVGAGGKTSTLLNLFNYAQERNIPAFFTTTTKIYASDITNDYLPIITESYDEGAILAKLDIQRGYALWFKRRQEEKLIGLPSEWIEKMAAANGIKGTYLIEADGASRRLLKAPAEHEPVIPDCTTLTLGIVNFRVLDLCLTDNVVHRLDRVCRLLEKEAGAPITVEDLAVIASHSKGIFQYSRGKRIVLVNGAHIGHIDTIVRFVTLLKENNSPVSRVILTHGQGLRMQAVKVYDL